MLFRSGGGAAVAKVRICCSTPASLSTLKWPSPSSGSHCALRQAWATSLNPAWGTMGSKGLCGKYLMPVLKKQQYRLQMVNPAPMVSGREACSPVGASTILPHSGRVYPVVGEDMGFLVWRKRNCCVRAP